MTTEQAQELINAAHAIVSCLGVIAGLITGAVLFFSIRR